MTDVSKSQGNETTVSADTGAGSAVATDGVEVGAAAEKTAGTDTSAKAGAVAGGTAESVYSPNYKFKVMDQELEFDEWVKKSIKDAETEKKARDLYAKAYGLEHVKNDRQAIKTQYEELKKTHTQTEEALNKVVGMAQAGDLEGFFQAFDLPIEKVLRFALEYAQRTPEQQEYLASQRAAQQRQQEAELRYQQLAQSNEQLRVQQRTFELDQQLSRTEVASVAQMFDSRLGQPGAFRMEVIRRGQLHAASGQDISAKQAVSEVMRIVGMQAPVSTDGHSAAATTKVVQPNSKPVLPNIQGRGASAVKKTPKSLDDLRRMAEAAAGV